MKIYLNAGFGELIGSQDLDQIAGLGFEGIRQDLHPGIEELLMREFLRTPLKPLFLLGGGKMHEQAGPLGWRAGQVAKIAQKLGLKDIAIEIGNEPDIAPTYKDRPDLFALAVRSAARAIWDVDPRIPVVTGGIMSTNQRGLQYLDAAINCGIPEGVKVGYHTYRSTSLPGTPHNGLKSRDEEFEQLLIIADGRRLWNTEIGWHTAESKLQKGFPLCFLSRKQRWTEDNVAEFLWVERGLNRDAGAEVMVVYQYNDGPTDTGEDRFGIRRFDGSLKPSSEVAR